jgi:predicted SAM-dependent methyltransferase
MIGHLLRSARSRFGSFRDARRLRAIVRRADPLRIVLGASGIHDAGWIPTEIGVLDILKVKQWSRVFAHNSIDAILAEHVWEHLTPEQGLLAARNCLRFLKPGGYLRVAVPDGFHPDPNYIDWVRVGGSGAGADDHKVLYNCQTFRGLFQDAGFEVELLEYFNPAGVFHASTWGPAAGKIYRSQRFDERNQNGALNYTSIIVDARKPLAPDPRRGPLL